MITKIFWIVLLVLMTILVLNWLFGSSGTYIDHTDMIYNLLKKPFLKKDKASSKIGFESKGEKECRRVLEKYTGKLFSKKRPSFLRNHISGHNLELDCFNDDLKLALEYNGEQHYKYIPYFHSTKDSFYNLKYKDDIKQRLCAENGIHLIIVPYTIPFEHIEKYVKDKLEKIFLN